MNCVYYILFIYELYEYIPQMGCYTKNHVLT